MYTHLCLRRLKKEKQLETYFKRSFQYLNTFFNETKVISKQKKKRNEERDIEREKTSSKKKEKERKEECDSRRRRESMFAIHWRPSRNVNISQQT